MFPVCSLFLLNYYRQVNGMDKTSIIGIMIGFFALLFGMHFKGISFSVLLNPAAIVIIFAGTIAAVTIAFPTNE